MPLPTERSAAIYVQFRILRLFLDSMASALVIVRHLKRSKPTPEVGGDAQSQYNQQVVTSLNTISEHLLLLEDPLACVETLELLFALLFLKTDDLCERDVSSDSCDENEISLNLTSSNSTAPPPSTSPLTPTPPVLLNSGEMEGIDLFSAQASQFKRVAQDHGVTFQADATHGENDVSSTQQEGESRGERKRATDFSCGSSSSYSASVKSHCGFVCCEVFMRDSLVTIKASVAHALKLLNTRDARVKASKTEAEVKCRLLKLQQHVSEASWRFQLVSSDSTPIKFGDLPKKDEKWLSKQQTSEKKEKRATKTSDDHSRGLKTSLLSFRPCF